jgi:hypothetical protein
MKSSVLIPVSTLALGACGPAFVGDFELRSLSFDGETYAGATGSLEVDKDLNAELRLNWTYDGYAYSMSLDGDADEDDSRSFSLDLQGSYSYVDSYGDTYSYSASGDLDCELDGDELRCTGSILRDGSSYSSTLEFELD